ncbi:unnamed protein product [Scytosiphon promiscuus]
MYLRLLQAPTGLPAAVRAASSSSSRRTQLQLLAGAASAVPEAVRCESARPSGGPTAVAAAVAAAAAAASLATWDDVSNCEGEKIVWVDAYGKKVAVHEKGPQVPGGGSGQPEPLAPERYYPYVILGYGVAGRAALTALLERDPSARVLVVDAREDVGLDPPPTQAGGGNNSSSGSLTSVWLPKKAASAATVGAGVDFARGARATALNADLGQVTLSSPAADGSSAAERANTGAAGELAHGTPAEPAPASGRNAPRRKQEVVAFGRCLLALGSRPRPPPPGFIDPSAREGVALLGARDGAGGLGREEMKREVEAGKSVTVVGSSWQALELACWLQEGRGAGAAWAGMEKGLNGGGACRMVFSDYAPLDHILPRYLSVALLRRLNRKNIKTIGHSSLRWVGLAGERTFNASPSQAPAPAPPDSSSLGLESPEGGAAAAGAAAEVAKDLDGDGGGSIGGEDSFQDGMSSGPIVMTAHSFDHLDTATHSTDRVVLAGVDVAPLDVSLDLSGINRGGSGDRFNKRAAALEVDRRRGAVIVNAELAASSRVWVAGDLACFPSQVHGGRRLRYNHTPAFVGEAPLAGVRVAMLGECDAAMTTHGFCDAWRCSAWGQVSHTSVALGAFVWPVNGSRSAQVFARNGGANADQTNAPSATEVCETYPHTLHRQASLFGKKRRPETRAVLKEPRNLRLTPPARTTGRQGVHPRVRDGGGFLHRRGGATPAAEAAAGISARALDLLRTIMERSANMEADLSDERVMQAWVQGLSDAARVVAQETGVGHLHPVRRSVAGRVTSSTRRPPGTRDELMYQNTSKTSSAQRRLRAAYAARIRGVSPADLPNFGSTGAEAEFDPEMMGFLSYGDEDLYGRGGGNGGGANSDPNP